MIKTGIFKAGTVVGHVPCDLSTIFFHGGNIDCTVTSHSLGLEVSCSYSTTMNMFENLFTLLLRQN